MNKMMIVFQDVTMTNIMQNADCFERFKVMLKGSPLLVTTSTPFADFVQRMQTIKDTVAPIAIRDDGTGEQWIDETVKVVSTGHSWVMFDKYLKAYGFKVEDVK